MTDSNTELLLFFYIQKRIEMVSEEIAFMNDQCLSLIQDEGLYLINEEHEMIEKIKQQRAAILDLRKERAEELETYKTKRDALMEIIEGDE